jgi:peptide chain release factor subunit 1
MLRTLSAAKSLNNSTSLITLYIPASTKISDLSKMIITEISEASNIKSRQTRQGVQDALQAVSTHIKRMKKLPTNGVVIMTGETTTGFESAMIEPKRPIDRFLYRCDNKFCV